MNVHWRATVPLEDKQLRDFWTPLQFHMGFESVPWVDIWPSKNCCAKSFACLIHGDPLIRCSKGWPMAHFYHHSFAFAETPRASSPGRTTVKQKVDAPDCGRRAKKSCHSYRSNFFNTFQLQCVFFQSGCHPAYFLYSKYSNQTTTTNLVVWAHRRLWGQWYFETFYGK